MRSLLAIALMIPALAFAHDPVMFWTSDQVLLVRTNGQEIFWLMPGGCLRGPLKFYDERGAASFQLDAGADYPVGCSRAH